MPRVLVTDSTFPDLDLEAGLISAAGGQLDPRQCKTPAALIEAVGGADAILTQFAPVNAAVIAAMDRARVIVRYGIGVDNVDLDAARAKGIPVCNIPDYCIDEVADHTLAFLLGLTRQVVRHANHLRDGQWSLAVPLSEMRTVRDLTVGVVGFGRIGRAVVKRLVAFGGRVQVFDPIAKASDIAAAGAEPASSVQDLLRTADVLTLHCPSTASTRKMINAEALAAMKPGAILLNLSRGDLVDTNALVEALQSGRLAAAGLDVCDPEPIPAGHPLRSMANVIVAPHVASTSEKAVRRLRETAAGLIVSALRGEKLVNVVNGVSA